MDELRNADLVFIEQEAARLERFEDPAIQRRGEFLHQFQYEILDIRESTLDQSLSRARFDATKLAELDDLQKAVIADRIQRHEGDKFQMPPRLSGTMPQWAVTRVLDYLGQ